MLIAQQLTKLAESVQIHDGQIKTIVRVLEQMMEKPPEKPKGGLGFQMPPVD